MCVCGYSVERYKPDDVCRCDKGNATFLCIFVGGRNFLGVSVQSRNFVEMRMWEFRVGATSFTYWD